MGLTRLEILAAEDRKLESVKVPEWGGDGIVYLRPMGGTERAHFEALAAGQAVATGQVMEKLIAFTACDENGNLLFTSEDVAELAKKNAGVLMRVFSVASRLNALSDVDVEALKGN